MNNRGLKHIFVFLIQKELICFLSKFKKKCSNLSLRVFPTKLFLSVDSSS